MAKGGDVGHPCEGEGGGEGSTLEEREMSPGREFGGLNRSTGLFSDACADFLDLLISRTLQVD